MKYFYVFALAVLFNTANAQNLIVDPSFEEFWGDCNPFSSSNLTTQFNFNNVPTQICGLKNWISISLTTDVYSNKVNNGFSSLPTNVNNCKYVNPHSDSCCVGGFQYLQGIAGGSIYREIFEGKLVTSLIAGHRYKFSIWTQLFDTIYPNVGNIGKIVGINSFSAYFSQQPIQTSELPSFILNIVNYTPQVQIWQMVTDTQHWVLLQDTFVAAGGEQYVCIGNFKTDAQIQTQLLDSIRNLPAAAYYYYDDVSLIDITPNGVEEIGVSKLEVYPNPCGEKLLVTGYQLLGNTIQITDVLGRTCISPSLEERAGVRSMGDFSIDVSSLPNGIYFIKATDSNGNMMNGKFVKE